MNEDVEKRDTLKEWVREMEVDVVLSIPAAKFVRESLDNFIKIAETMAAESQKQQQKPNA